MPRKVKKSCKSGSFPSGFLRPTLASQRRCIGYSNQLLPSPKLKKKKSPKKNLQTTTSNDLSGSFNKQPDVSSGLQSAVQVYATNHMNKEEDVSYGGKCINDDSKLNENRDLTEAKKMCEELKEQINELRLHQQSYEFRMRSFNNDNSANCTTQQHYFKSPRFCDSFQRLHDENRQLQTSENSQFSLPHPNSVIRVNIEKNSKPLQDSSNLPEQLSYNEAFHKSETAESVIKKLHSERDKYKRKVLKLKTELKIVRNSKKAFIKSPEISPQDLVFYNADLVGEGRLGALYEGTLYNKPVAVKKLVRSGIMSSSDRSYLTAEAGLLLPLEHQNIVKVLGVCSTPMEPLIVTEFVNGKSVLDLLRKSGGSLDSATFFSVSRDVSIGMAYLHSQKPPVLHLNLRPSNVVTDSFLRAKVTDFGFSKIRMDAGVSGCSNLAYLAPELVKFPAQITVKTDVFAFAVLMWQMSTGRDPMAGRTTSQILDMMEQNQRLHIQANLPPAIRNLVTSCWDSSPVQRPSFKEIILEFETMNLPDSWIAKLKQIGISRADMSDMGSVIQDSNSVTSSISSVSQDKPAPDITVVPVRYHTNGTYLRTSAYQHSTPSHVLHENHFPHSRTQPPTCSNTGWNNCSSSHHFGALNCDVHTVSRGKSKYTTSPISLKEVHYIPRSDLNAPEIMSTEKQMPDLHSDEELGKADRVASERSTSSGSDKLPMRDARTPWRGGTAANAVQTRSDKVPSKFDNKFHDFVTDACQAESSSKLHASTYTNWPHLQVNANRQKNKSLVSSDNIRVRSVSTPSCSSSATASKASSMDTAVYNPLGETTLRDRDLLDAALSATDGDVKVSPLAEDTIPKNCSVVDNELRSEFKKSTEILNNAKKLLSTSPLRSSLRKAPVKPPSSLTNNFYPTLSNGVKPLPEYKPSSMFEHRHSRSEPIHLRSETSSQEGSSESFLPLPPRLQTPHYAFPLPTTSKPPSPERDNTSGKFYPYAHRETTSNYTANPLSLEINGPSSAVTDGMQSDQVARILHRTAGELDSASNLLHATSERLEKERKLKKMPGSI